jgi:hypothetical protein
MSKRDMEDLFLDNLESKQLGPAVMNTIQNIRTEKAISRDWRLLCALRDAESGDPTFGVDKLSEGCADIAEEYDVSPELMNRAINLGRTSLQ